VLRTLSDAIARRKAELILYEEVFRELHRLRVRYLVTGGIAVNLHGYARLTMDLDIMLDLEESNLVKFVEAMENLGYEPRVPVAKLDVISSQKREVWIREKGAIVFTFIEPARPYREVDIFLSNPIDFSNAYAGKHTFVVNDIPIPVASVKDLVFMKKKSDRPRDREDIIHLERLEQLKGGKPK
jgi:hypothetical protein